MMTQELSRRGQKRVERLHTLYVNDEIDIHTLDTMLGHALQDEPPFLKDVFKSFPDVRRKRYTEDTVWLYQGDEYLEDGEYIVAANAADITRTIDVTPSYEADL